MSGATSPPDQQPASAPTVSFPQPMVPNFAFNGFVHQLSATEITSLLTFGGRPLTLLIMHPAVAKSFAKTLMDAVQHYEAATRTQVSTIPELADRITQYQENTQK